MELAGKHRDGLDFEQDSRLSSRFTIRLVRDGVRAAVLTMGLAFGSSAEAVGLGAMHLHSALGQPLRVQVGLVSPGENDLDQRCYKARVMSLDGASLGNVAIDLNVGGASPVIALSTSQSINEPALTLSVEYTCGSQTRRDYQILLDLMPVSHAVVDTPRSTPASAVEEKNPAEATAQVAVGTATEAKAGPKKANRRHLAIEIKPSSEYAQPQPASATESKETRRRKSPTKAFRNVLRLGSDDSVDSDLNDTAGMHLTLSRSLFGSSAISEAQTEVPVQGAPSLPSGSASAPAVSNNAVPPTSPANPEVAAHPADSSLQELQAKIRVLEAETDELRKLNAKHLAALDSAQSGKAAGSQLLYLYFMLFASFAAITWLVWRTRQIQSNMMHSSWHQIVPEQDLKDEHQQSRPESDAFFDRDGEHDREHDTNNVTPLRQIAKTAAVEEEGAAVSSMNAPQPLAAAQTTEHAESDYKFHANVRSTLPDAEEILDEIQQAEFWMDMQQPQRAIEILESNWGEDRPSSPLPWLYLFDLYRMVGDQKKYEELTARFENIFNGKVIPWGDGNTLEHSRSLDEFPLLMKKIVELWHTEDLVPFLEGLLIDDRDGRRQGFDLAAYRDILFLTNIAYEIQDSNAVSKAPQSVAEWSAFQ